MFSGRLPYRKHYEMPISDTQQVINSSLTKCAKMTEEAIKKHGMNGNSDVVTSAVKEEVPRNNYVQGGRLKFFKGNLTLINI